MREKTTADGPEISIIKYASKQDYDEYLLKHCNISNMRGCFDRDNHFGQIYLTTFNISIKSLVTNFSYQKNVTLD